MKNYRFITVFILCFCSLVSFGQKPRILVSTDIGGTDPDDNQSMTHLLMYSDLFEIEGLVSSPSYGKGSKGEIIRMIGLYEKDYPQLKKHYPALMSPDALRSIAKQGRQGEAPINGYNAPTEGSEWIVKCARKYKNSEGKQEKLWILVWGALEDVAQALHDAPDIADKINIYWIGGPNKKWGCNAYNYIVCNFPNLWFIECNAAYRGFIGSATDNSTYGVPFWETFLKGHGALGNDYQNYYKGITKAGDTPSLLYLMGKDEKGRPFDINDPTKPHWGGQFEPIAQSPKYIISGALCKEDTVPVYSLMEWRLKGPKLDIPEDSVCFTLLVDKQTWRGHYVGNGEYIVRYAPKAPATLKYVISSAIKGFPAHEGVFVVGEQWPAINQYHQSSATIKAVPITLGKTWWTDLSDKKQMSGVSDYEDYNKLSGKWQGAGTIARWRNNIMQDWAERFGCLK